MTSLYCIYCGTAQRPSGSLAGRLAPGSLLKARYRLVSLIGQGGFGAVYQAQDTQLANRQAAIKEMNQHGLSPQEVHEATEAFQREAHLLAALQHPSLPAIYDAFHEAGCWYLVMEFIDGITLETKLAQALGGCLSVHAVAQIGLKLCDVLSYLHTRQPPIIFRDLKPSNVMHTSRDDLYLIDFGIARLFKLGQARDTVAIGSPGYAAPEQYGKAQTTIQSDIYSLGVVLHQLLSGCDPSLNQPLPWDFAPLPASLPAGLAPLIRQMVQLRMSDRPNNVEMVKTQLQQIITRSEPAPQPQVQTPPAPSSAFQIFIPPTPPLSRSGEISSAVHPDHASDEAWALVEQRMAVLNRCWQALDDLHARQKSGMRPLWGLVEDAPTSHFLRDLSHTPYQPQLYRSLLPSKLLGEIQELWGTMLLPNWPDRLVSTPFPHVHVAKALGPALSFWHGCALTAWFYCEGPDSRTDIAGLAEYFHRQIQALRDIDTPIDERLFDDLLAAEKKLIPEPPIQQSLGTRPVAGRVSLSFTVTIPSRKKRGFEYLREIITRYRRNWTKRYWTEYVRRQAEREIDKASSAFNQRLAGTGQPPTPKQFAKVAAPVTNYWFGGDLSRLYGAIGEPAPIQPTRMTILPSDVVGFAQKTQRALGTQIAFRPAKSPPSQRLTSQQTQTEQQLRELAELSVWYAQVWEALGRAPDISDFGRSKFVRNSPVLAADVNEAWDRYTVLMKRLLGQREQ